MNAWKRPMRWAAGLYPRAWRQQYGVEFEALLEDIPAGWRPFLNVLTGAFQMQVVRGKSYWKAAAVLGVAGAFAGGLWSLTMGSEYRSTVTLTWEGPPGVAMDRASVEVLKRQFLSTTSLAGVIMNARTNVYGRERAAGEPLFDLAMRMRARIDWQTVPNGVQISFTYPDAVAAQRTARHLGLQVATFFANRNRYLIRTWQSVWPNRPLATVVELRSQSATWPVRILPNLPLHVALGFVCAILLGLAGTLAFRQPRAALRVACCALLGVAMGVAASSFVRPMYTSAMTMIVSRPLLPIEPADTASLTEQFRQVERATFDDQALAFIARRHLGVAGAKLNIHLAAAAIRRNLEVRMLPDASGFQISFSDYDRGTAQRVVTELLSALFRNKARADKAQIQARPDLAPLLARGLGVQYLAVEAPSFSWSPSSHPRRIGAGVGLLFGLILGAVSLRLRPPGPRLLLQPGMAV